MLIRDKVAYVYDIEVFPNVFTCTIKNTETKEFLIYEISDRKNDINALVDLFWTIRNPNVNKFDYDLKTDKIFVGYNNIHYDNPIVNYIIDYHEKMLQLPVWKVTNSIFKLSEEIISSSDNNFSSWSKWKYATFFETLDLLTMLFSNKLRVGLKEMEVTMQIENVDEYQGSFKDWLPNNKIDDVLLYNKHDVEATEELLYRCKKDIDLRLAIEEEYKIKALNKDGVNLGVEIIKQKYLQATGKKWSDIKDLRSPCDTVALKDVILPYVKFTSPILQNLLNELKQLVVSPGRKGLEKEFIIGGVKHLFSVGGLHSINKPEEIIPNESQLLVDQDVASLYPSLIIENKFYPPHLGPEFLEVYSKIKEERIEAKHNGEKTKDLTLKLALNGLSGMLQNEHSFCYSPFTVLQVRINGQLSLLMLIEKLVEIGCKIVQTNTDGVFYLADNQLVTKINEITKWWQDTTKLVLEADEFESMYQFAINDYVAVKSGYSETKNPKLIKKKGLFIDEVSLGKGMNALIIPEAINKCLIDNIPVAETIRNCKNIHKFITYQKVSKDYCVEYDGKLIQRINRFYFSKTAPWLYKCKVDSEGNRSNYIKLNSQTGVQICNVINKDFKFPDDINYEYYIKEAQKIVDLFKCKQLTLF